MLMVTVTEFKLEGYKIFYAFYHYGAGVFVNKQSQFKQGQKDVYGSGDKLSKEYAKKVRNMKADVDTWDHGVDLARKHLQVNGFDLEKE